MSPWKTPRSSKPRRNWALLQCGHGDVAVEDQGDIARLAIERELQCGHGDVAVEDCPLSRWFEDNDLDRGLREVSLLGVKDRVHGDTPKPQVFSANALVA